MANKYNYHANNKKVGNRLAQLRVDAGMKQEDLAIRLSEISKRKTLLSVGSVSSWETGRRNPSSEFVSYLADIYNVSQAYILGLTDDPHQEEADNKEFDGASANVKNIARRIDPTNLFLYDKKPIYVTFKGNKHIDQWGIYNATSDQFIMADFTIRSTASSIDELFSFAPYVLPTKTSFIQNMDALMNAESVFVRMTTSDKEVKELYDGWYSHNENKTRLINQLGLTLPYLGLNISYCAYSL